MASSQALSLAASSGVAPRRLVQQDSLCAIERAHSALVQVLRLLPLDVRARAARVCSGWRDAAADPALWRALRFDGCKAALSDATLALLCARAGVALRELHLDSPGACDAVTSDGLFAALRNCAGLLRLTLPPADFTAGEASHELAFLSVKAVKQLAGDCPSLECVECWVDCESAEDVAAACGLLRGPLKLCVKDHNTWLAAWQPLAGVAGLVFYGSGCSTWPTWGALKLGWALRTNETLTSLNLGNSTIGAAGAAALAQALRTNGTLKLLDLNSNRIGDAGAKALAEALRTNATLTSLGLSSNDIDDVGAEALGEALRNNSALTSLVLSFNYIRGASAAALALGGALTTLDLSQNVIGDKCAVALATALRSNAALTTLDLGHNRVGDAGVVALGNALCTNVTLKSLCLWSQEKDYGDEGEEGSERIGDAGATALGEALSTNATLTSLETSFHALGVAAAAALAQALRTNTTLTKLPSYHEDEPLWQLVPECWRRRGHCCLIVDS